MASTQQAVGNSCKLQALLVEDNPLDAELVVCELERDGFEVCSDRAQTEAEFRQRLAATRYDVILADHSLPQWSGIEAVEIVRQQGLDIPVILVTGSLGDVNAVECIKHGVTDYVLKDKLARLPLSVRRSMQERSLRQQHKQAEEALRQSQEQMEAIIQSAMDAIITTDEQQQVVMFNAAAERMFGCAAAEAVGQSISRFIPQRFRAAHAAHLQHFAEGGVSKRSIGKLGELRALRTNGEEFAMEASISRTKVGARSLFTVILRDVTERKRAEEALHESREQYRVLFDEMLMGFALFEPIYDGTGTPCDFRYLEVNQARKTHCGLGRDRVIGKTIREILPGLEPIWIETYGKVAITGESIHFDSYAELLGRWLELTVFRTCKNQVAVTFADITERKRSEEELAKKVADLAGSNRELEQFAYVASHDLQEPLRMVASYTQLLAERYHGKLDDKADKYIAYAVEGALRMQALLNDLLAFSRVGRDGPGHTPTDCNAVLEHALQNLRVAIQESGAVITHDPLPIVLGDHGQLVQLFQNLIGNAIKFRGKEPPVISVSARQEADAWTFAVADNGIGIASEHRELIFVIFQRLHTRAEYPGNGVGLAICKKIVEQHRGRIWVESDPGRGSVFRFTLSTAANEEESQHESHS